MAVLSFDVFWRDHGANRGSRQLGENAERSAEQFQGMRDAVKTGALAAGIAIGVFGKKSIEVANDIAESQSKVGVVFGDSAGEVQAFAETTAKSMGISKRSALDATGTFGNLLVSLKLPQAEAAKMSIKMVTLAADMASFNNASPEEALDAIRSGLMGETEPLQRFGVNMNDATLRTQALKMGLIGSVKEGLNPAVKAQAAYGLMLAQTGTAQGDFARTADGMANQQRILKARFEDLQGELGEKLLPAVNKVLTAMLGLLGVVSDNAEIIIPLVAAIAGFAAAVWVVNKAIAVTTATHAAWTAVMIRWNTMSILSINNMIRMAAVARTATVAFGLLAVGMAADEIGNAIGKYQAVTVNIEDMSKAMAKNAGQAKLSNQEIQLFSDKGIFGLGKETLTTKDALDKFAVSAFNALDQGWNARLGRWQSFGSAESEFRKQTEQLDQAFANMVRGGNVSGAEKQMQMYENAAKEAGVPLASLRKMFPEYAKAVADAKPPVNALTGATKSHTKAVQQDTAKLLENAQAMLRARGSENAYEQAIDDATQALKDNGRTLDKHTEKGRNNRQALDAVASSTLEWRDAARDAGASVKRQTQITENGRAELVRMGRRFGMTKKDAREYAREVLGIPKRVSSEIRLSLKNGIPSTLYGIRIGSGRAGGSGGITRGMATGGPVRGPGTGTSDSIPAAGPGGARYYLSNGEHVLTSSEVVRMGGHSGVERFRRSVRGYALGGGIGRGIASGQAGIASSASSIASAQIRNAVNEGLGALLGGALGGGGSGTGLVAFGRWLQARGFSVGEHPAFGGVSPVHVRGSAHYSGRAIDVNKGAGTSSREQAYLRPIVAIARGKGFKTIFMAPGHYNHAHIAYDQGGMLASGQSGMNRSGRPERVLSGQQTQSFDRLVQVMDRRSSGGTASSAGADIDYVRLGDTVARSISKAGLVVKIDGRAIGTVLGSTSSLLGRAG